MTKTNFQAWLDEAEMPTKTATSWVDLETGIAYNPAHDYRTGSARKSLSAGAQDARAVAKAFGGKALKGTAKQKEWAEKIRSEKLAQMGQDQAEMACDPNGLLTNSKFWIENRSAAGAAIGDFVMQQKALLAQHRAAKTAGDAVKVAAIATEYNALTAKWGF